MDREPISTSQLTMMTASFITTGPGLTVIKDMIMHAGQDTWMSFFPAMLYSLVVICFMIWFAKGRSEASLFEANRAAMGTFFGSLFNILFFFYVLISISIDIRELGEYIKGNLLWQTPLSIIILSILGLIVYLVRAGLEVQARVNHIYFLVTLGMYFSLPILLLNELTPSNLQPVFASGWTPLWRGSVSALGQYSSIIIICAIAFAYTPNREPGKMHPLIRGLVLGTVALTVLVLTVIGTVGVAMSSKGMYPALFMVQMIHITDFLDRLDVLMGAIYFPSMIMRICFSYYALCLCISAIGTSKTEGRAFAIVLVPLVLLFATFSFRNVVDLLVFESEAWPVAGVLLDTSLILVLFVAAKLRKERRVHL